MKSLTSWTSSLLLFTLFITSTFGQAVHQDKIWEFNADIPAANRIYQARDYITLDQTMTISSSQNMVFELNEELIYSTDYQSFKNPSQRVLDVSLEVGTTPGSFYTTPSGAGIYNIPLQLAPGISGMHPSLSINYSSQAGNGELGLGWSLGGVSSITRTGQSLYYDNAQTEVNLTSQDRFMLDGKRIVNGPTAYGSIGDAHFLEIHDYTKITPGGSAGTGPSYFEVVLKDGTKYYYGNYDQTNAYLKSNDNTTIVAWHLAKIVDRQGNYIRFIYQKDEINGETWLTEIEYTGNTVTGKIPFNRVKIFYQNRADVTISYIKGCKFTVSKLVRKIETLCEGKLVREYVPKYIFDNVTKLNEIEEYNSKGKRYNSTIIKYGDVTASNQIFSPYINEDINKEIYFGFADINADGITDFIKCRKLDGQFNRDFEWEVWMIQNNSMTKVQSGTWDFSNVKGFNFLPGDYNGDGLGDIAVCAMLNDGTDDSKVYLFESSGSSLQCNQSDYFYTGYAFNTFAADLNADGMTELININSPIINTYQFNPNNLAAPPTIRNIALNLSNNKVAFGYFDRNMKPDIVSVSNNGLVVYELSLSAYSQIFSNFPAINLSNISRLYTGDFNGDKNLDILTWKSNTNWKLYTNTGNTLISATPPALPNIDMEETSDDNNIFIKDYNYDGVTDVLYTYHSAGKTNMDLYRSKSNGFTKESFNDQLGYAYSNKNYIKTFTDFNGDGLQDIFCKVTSDGTMVAHLIKTDQRRLVQTIVNGLNMTTSIVYTSLSIPNNNTYTKGTQATNPLEDICGPIYVVKSATQTANGKTLNNKSYKYEEARIHKFGKGFLGFRKFIELDNLTGIQKSVRFQTEIVNNQLYFYTYPIETSLKKGSTYISRTFTEVDLSDFSYNKRFTPSVKQVQQIDYLKDVEVLTTYNSYDINGNPTSITTESNADYNKNLGNGVNEYTETKTISYWPHTNERYLPETITTVSQAGESPSVTTVKKITYTSTHLPDVIKSYYGTAFEIWEDKNYDQYGNVEEFYIKDPSGNNLREISFEYEPNFRFVTKSTNKLGHSVKYNIDYKTGQTVTTENAQGIVLSNIYDAFDRVIATSDGISQQTYTYKWSNDGYIENDVICISTINDDNSYIKEYFDAFGRKIHQKSPPIYGTYEINQSIVYDTEGNIGKVSKPYDDISKREYITREYDDFGRIEQIHGTGVDIGYTYSLTDRRKTIITNNNKTDHTRWVKTNSLGNVIHASDPGGEIQYYYNSIGLTDSIISPNGTVIKMTYDITGNQLSLNDPDAGLTTYQYDILGQLVKQTNARGKITDIEYDDLGRLTESTTTGEGTNTVSYVLSGPGLGLIESITNSNTNITYTYEYDKNSRIKKYHEAIEGTTYTYEYEFDIFGRNSSIIYPGGSFEIKYNYGNYGELEGVYDSEDNLIWKINEVSAKGQLKELEFGNGLTTNYDFDNFDYLTEIITQNSGGTKLQHLTYDFDSQTGNLDERTDELLNGGAGLTEYFTYDEMDRLESYRIGSNPAIDVSYQNNLPIQIDNKEDIGDYFYGEGSKPENALSRISNSDGSQIDRTSYEITYNSFNDVKSINLGNGNKELDIVYGPSNERKITVYKENGNPVKKKLFIGGLYEIDDEMNGTVNHFYYIPGIGGEVAIYKKVNSNLGQMYYIHADNLGSYQTITNSSGNVIQTLSYDPWGRRRNPFDWSFNSVPSPLFARGFTGHEHLDEFGLINMNGRVFDPISTTFLSVDNYIQAPGYTQSYNRYSYAFGNPLKYTDPSGDYLSWIIGGIIGGITNVIAHHNDIDTFWDWFGYYNTGSAAGMFSVMLAETGVGAPAVGMVSGFILEFGNTLTEGGDFYDAMDAGVKGGLVGGGLGFVTEAIIAPVAQSIISKFDYHLNNAYSRTHIGDYMIQYDNKNGYQIFNSFGDEITGSVMNNVVGNSINGANSIILASYSPPAANGGLTSKDGWVKVPGGYIPAEGEEQLYYAAKDGRLVPSWRAENLSESSFKRSFHHLVNPNEVGPYVTSNQINFNETVNNITPHLGHPFYDGNSFHIWSGDNMILSIPGSLYPTPQSGNSVAWQSSGYIPKENHVFFFTLTVTR